MGFKRWQDLQHPGTPAERASQKRDALEEYDRLGYAALRKARSLTQVELAKRLEISQGSVASLEARTDLHISTLSKYIRAMGGRLEMQAVFAEATFNLEPLASLSEAANAASLAKTVRSKPVASVPAKPARGARRTAAAR